ncbi:hypothetical protein RJ640_014135 [Escallonia rubra]|uniref:Receptor-like protein 12 n=1 Tax=Escallonia rubra TaxID=112253 RepID=A0AA88UMB1_9ASTE|nr:hypothetical protein RJ640_014135 [Escallonia rubra]
MLNGSLKVPPPSTLSYRLSDNNLTGEIPLFICQESSISILDLSNNDMNGTIPPCLGNFSDSFSILNLKGNNFSGTIPQIYTEGNNIRMIDLSQNHLEGQVPRSLANCGVLEVLNLGDNKIEDTFPFWLGDLPQLRVLILSSNKFHGAIRSPKKNGEFPKLHIIDLSYNNFSGVLPLGYFETWSSMKTVEVKLSAYLQANVTIEVQGGVEWEESYLYSMTMTNKGVKLIYERILGVFTAVDLSSNKFRGEIPESIGHLKGLQLLSLSNNNLTGGIPPSLGSLTKLESLDLSQNKLSGEIPQQLTLLTFLAFIDLSHNHLVGPIPRENQFSTFGKASYEGNSALCGVPSSNACASQAPTPHLTTETRDGSSSFLDGVDCIVISMGLGSGLIVGFIIGQNLTTRHHEWFNEKFGMRQRKRKRR